MTETDYQNAIRPLWKEMQERADTAVDYLVTQPPIRLARKELYALLEWALTEGAAHPELVHERLRRRQLTRARSSG